MVSVPLTADEAFNEKMRELARLDEQTSEEKIYSLFDLGGCLCRIRNAITLIGKARESSDPLILTGIEKMVHYARTHDAPHIQFPFIYLGFFESDRSLKRP